MRPFSQIYFASAVMLLLAAGPSLHAGGAAPHISKPAVKAAVTMARDDRSFTLDNGIVTARINRRTGDLESLIYRGTETMGRDQGRAGYWEQDPSRAPDLKASVTIDPTVNGGARAEVSIAGKTGGTVMLSPSAPGGGTYCDLEIRYALDRGESGIYAYAIYSHPAAYGAMGVGESRFITKLSQAFDWISVDADRNLLECAPVDWGTGVVVHAKEQRILSRGVYQNSVEHKYSYTAVQYKIPAYGWSSTKEKIGIWFINPTIEYLGGGATKQELVCHLGDNGNPDPIILNYWRGTHYGGGASCNIAAGEEWSKVVGPMFIYVNSLDRFQTPAPADLDQLAATAGNPIVPPAWQANATALWQDALAQAAEEKMKWPYDWVNGVDYPHQLERGSVSGKIALNDPQAASKELPQLTVGLAFPDAPGSAGATGNSFITIAGVTNEVAAGALPIPPTPAAPPPGGAPGSRRGRGGRYAPRPVDWVHDAKHYQFWTDGAPDGRFTIPNVRPGTYTLHAFADGVLGEFAQANITVAAGRALDLGKLEWKPVRYGRQVWEIGYPDRTGGKFLKGDGADYWLWGWGLRYPLLFPNDVTYTIGKSDYRKDWFFQQTPHGESTAWMNPNAKDPANQRFGWVKAESLAEYPQSNQRGPWGIYGRGRACTWTIKFKLKKASQGVAALRLALAGADTQALIIGVNGTEAGTIHPLSTNALRYNTDKGVWQEQILKFEAALLKAGENEIQITVPAGDLTSGVVYDYLRLELDDNTKLDSTSAGGAGK